MKRDLAQVVRSAPVRSIEYRTAMKLCACTECCREQPWRREVLQEHRRQLKRSYAMAATTAKEEAR
jgi:hypothetical protein